MPYPLVQMPRMRDFIDRAIADYGAELKEPKGTLLGPRGKTTIKYLLRTGRDGKKKFAVLQNLQDDDRLTPNVLRSLCRQLDIPVEHFGLHLG